MSAETNLNETNHSADAASIRTWAARAFDQLTEGIQSLQQLQSAVGRSNFDDNTGGRIERAIRLGLAAAENLSPWANEATLAQPMKPR